LIREQRFGHFILEIICAGRSVCELSSAHVWALS
jgi:hypothetical protein